MAFSLAGGLSYAQLARSTEDFGSVAIGSTSASISIQYHLAGLFEAPNISVTGAADFRISGKVSCSDANNCSVAVNFAPHSPGLRQGSVVVKDSVSNSVLAVTSLAGTGLSPQAGLLPGVISTLAGLSPITMKAPGSLAIDSVGNLFIADTLGNVVLKYTTATGKVSTRRGNGNSKLHRGWAACGGSYVEWSRRYRAGQCGQPLYRG